MKLPLICSALLTVASLSACVHHDGGMGGFVPSQTETTLTSYHWTMNRAVDASGNTDQQWIYENIHETPVTLTFDTQRLSVKGLCNNMGASYTIDGANINISQVMGTMKMCPDEALMRYEQAFGQRLTQASGWGITRMNDEPVEQPSLTLRFNDGAQWVLTGEPTAETKYGSKGEIMFLEVAPQTVACHDPMIPERQCLHVRTVNYDANGLKQSHGDWEYFYGYIDDYQHTPGVRNVLRVKRYTRQNVPADASSHAYVLDMVVESETVDR